MPSVRSVIRGECDVAEQGAFLAARPALAVGGLPSPFASGKVLSLISAKRRAPAWPGPSVEVLPRNNNHFS